MVHQKTNEIAPSNSSLCWLFRQLRGLIGHIGLLTVLQVTLSVCAVVYSLWFRDMVDAATGGDSAGFSGALTGVVLLTAAQLLIRFAGRTLEEETRSKAENTLKARLLDTLLWGRYGDVCAVHTGEWMNRLTGDTVTAADGAVQIIPQVAGMLVRLAGAICIILLMEPRFGCALLAVCVVFLGITRFFRPRVKHLHRKTRETDGAVRIYAQERLENQSIVRIFNRQEHTVFQAAERMDAHRSARRRSAAVANVFSLGFGGMIHGAYLFTAAYCGSGILRGEISYGTLTALLQLISQFQAPLSGLSAYLPRWYSMQASAQRLMEPEQYPREPEQLPLDTVRHFYETEFSGLHLKDVSFRYPGQETAVLRHLNLSVPKGGITALMGGSGLGKTTILKLLLGLFPPSDGTCMISELVPLSSQWRSLFAYVPQGNHLMSGTIRQSLAMYDEVAMTRTSDLWDALKTADADDFVSALEHGLDTVLGEDGAGLSEGQLQRLALARAVFSGRPILLLDESTSALDEETEIRVLQNLNRLADRTILIVSHRSRVREVCRHTILLSEEMTK